MQKDQKIFNQNNSLSLGDTLLILQNFKKTLNSNILYTKKVLLEKEALQEYSENMENDLKQIIREFKEE